MLSTHDTLWDSARKLFATRRDQLQNVTGTDSRGYNHGHLLLYVYLSCLLLLKVLLRWLRLLTL